MAITVAFLNLVLMQLWIKWSVWISTLEVASSKTRNLFFLRRARAKQRSCFWPTENISATFEMSVWSFYGRKENKDGGELHAHPHPQHDWKLRKSKDDDVEFENESAAQQINVHFQWFIAGTQLARALYVHFMWSAHEVHSKCTLCQLCVARRTRTRFLIL